MALFKNLYMDLSYLNPFKKSNSKKQVPSPADASLQVQSKADAASPENFRMEVPRPEMKKELPSVSRKLIEQEQKKLELPKVKKAEPKKVIEPPKLDINASQPNLSSVSKPKKTYFSNISSKDIMQSDVFKDMQSFWTEQKTNILNMEIHSKINDDLSRKIDELQRHEVEWQEMQLQHEKLKDALASKEIIIESQIKDLKKRFKALHFTAHTPSHNYFVLSDGSKIRSLQELSEFMHSMDDSVFFSHVNQSKNDFATWVKDVMNLTDLSEQMRDAKTKQELLDVIHDWKNKH